MDNLNNPFEDFLQNFPSKSDIEETMLSALLLGTCQMSNVPDEMIFIIRSLLKNGCPATVLAKTFIEVGEKLKEKGEKNDRKDD